MPGAGRLGDSGQNTSDAHGCPGCPHSTVGPAIIGSPTVNVNGRPALRVDDMGMHAACCGPNQWKATAGSATVFINGKAAHRIKDAQQHCGGLGKLIEGSNDVIIGDGSSGGGGSNNNPGGDDQAPQGKPAQAGSPPADPANSSSSETQPASAAGTPGSSAKDKAKADDDPASKKKDEPADAWLEVEIVDEEGAPAKGLAYRLMLPDGTEVKGKLDDRGRVRKDKLKPGVGLLYLADDDVADVPAWQPPFPPVEKADAFVAFRLQDESGRAAAGVKFRLVLTDGSTVEDSVDDTGYFRKDGIPAGTCTLYLPEQGEAAGVPTQGAPPPAAEKGWIEVVVVDDQGRPAAGLRYKLVLPGGKREEGKLDEGGRLRKDGVPVGTATIFLPDDEAGEVAMAAAAAPRPVEAKAWIEVVLVDDQGRARADAAFTLTLPDGKKRQGKTDSSGRARLDDLPAGTCQIQWTGLDAYSVEPRPTPEE